MQLLKKIGRKRSINGKWMESWGLFLCPYCENNVEKRLNNGKKNRSCGCVGSKLIGKSNTIHGDSKVTSKYNKLFFVWGNLKDRCNNNNSADYHRYGERGIMVCEEWENDYTLFKKWALNNGWVEGLMIDRIDNNGNYTTDNCRFITSVVSAHNRSTTVLSFPKVEEIRKLWKTGFYTQKTLGFAFGISQPHISEIVNNKQWPV